MNLKRIVSGGIYCQQAVKRAVLRHELAPLWLCRCVDCGAPARGYDHRDYNKPLSVEPVCHRCNSRRGHAIPRQWTKDELCQRAVRSARQLRVVPWAADWCRKVIENHCTAWEKATGGRITRQEMRPDLWPEPAPEAPERAGAAE